MSDTASNIEYLLHLAEDRSAESRNELVTIIKDLFENKSGVLSDREKNLMFKIIETLFHEVEVSIRRDLSEQLAERNDVPQDLITYLANDNIAVASPVLSHSELLRDEDLIKIIHQRTEEYHMAITLRREISEDISDALVETGHEDVIVSLLNNKNSRISRSTMEYLVEQSKRLDTFQDPLVHRDDLGEELAIKLFGWVSDALRQDISSKFDLPQDILDTYLAAPDNQNADRSRHLEKMQPNATMDLVLQLKAKDMLTPDVLVAALNQGEIALFVGVFAEMTGLDLEFTKTIVFDGNGEEIAVACKAIGVSEMQFLTVLRKTRRRLAPCRADLSPNQINKVLTFFRTMDLGNSLKALAAWEAHVENSSRSREP